MNIHKTQNGNDITLAIAGKLDSVTQGQLAEEVEKVFGGSVASLTFDLSALEYISSAGLRVLLAAYKKAEPQGTRIRICGANEMVKEIFRITGIPCED